MDSVQKIIQNLELLPHPEGGYYKEVYRSKGTISAECLSDSYSGGRNYSTSIYFLLTSDVFSAFHKINQDEIWHFYKGSPILLHIISPKGAYQSVVIGNEIEKGQFLQYVVPGGFWFAAEVIKTSSYSLLGCTVAPGFDFDDFVLPTRKDLISYFPEHKDLITRLSRPS